MPFFQVRLVGRNILREIEGRRELQGFVTTRVIDAASPEHAAEQGLELMYRAPELLHPLNGPDDPCPVVLVEEVLELGTLPPSRPTD